MESPRCLRRVAGRRHPELDDAEVISMGPATLANEVWLRMTRKQGWEQFIGRNEWFQEQALRRIPWEGISRKPSGGGKPVLFAYSYAALKLLRRAREAGWTTLLGQIDPGPLDSRIAEEEIRRWPEYGGSWQPAPAGYFEAWREELALADRIIVNSEWSRRSMISEGVPAERLAVIPLPYDETAAAGHPAKDYPESFTAERPLRVLFLGQVNLRKGVPELLAAMEHLEAEAVELWMAGPLKVTLPEHHATAGNIRWLGPLTRDQVGTLYQEADVFLFPTQSDGFGLTQLEAQAWRMPVIASGNCGDVVEDGKNGMRIEEVTPECIRRALIHCRENPALLRKWSEGAWIADRFRLDATGEAFLKVIREAEGADGGAA
jgi:glycosyltransferase involved in cell wall biosynthesis